MNVMVAMMAGTLFLLMTVSGYLNVQLETQTEIIRNNYIPLVELGYRLETQFENINLALRDAVSSQDNAALDTSVELKNKLVAEIDGAKGIVDQKSLNDLRSSIEDYFTAALETSHRLIAGETGVKIVESMSQMQSKRALADASLKTVAKFDRTKLSAAFSTISEVQKRSASIRFWVSLCSVLFISVITFYAGQSFIVRLNVISEGLERFGQGDFKRPIPVEGTDELSQLSIHVNMMAGRIQSLMREIEAFSYSVAHDLRAPVRSIIGFSQALKEDYGQSIPDEGVSHLNRVGNAAQKMGHMIDGLLSLSRLNRAPISKQDVSLSKLVAEAVDSMKDTDKTHQVNVKVEQEVHAWGDPKLLDVAVTNLVSNAWKFTKRTAEPEIEFGTQREGEKVTYFVKDNGAGFDMKYSDKLFGTFQRLHHDAEFEGHGIGLATVKNIIEKHGGRIWAESEVGKGTTFYFTLG
jgi:signal transduction histidine kinase